MIIDQFSNLSFYEPLIRNLDQGLMALWSFLDAGAKKADTGKKRTGSADTEKNPFSNCLPENLEPGRYEYEWGYFMVQRGNTKPMEEGYFEAHRKYIDIQIVAGGSEEVAWADLGDLKEEIPYDEGKDAVFYSGNAGHRMKVEAGMCYVAFPHDGHRPVRHSKEQQTYTKIVMKLPV